MVQSLQRLWNMRGIDTEEPYAGNFNDYTAHGIFAMARIRWP